MNEMLEKGLVVGSIAAKLEEAGEITFTHDMAYDDELLRLAEQLINEFNNPEYTKYNYFSEFVGARLLELEKESKN